MDFLLKYFAILPLEIFVNLLKLGPVHSSFSSG